MVTHSLFVGTSFAIGDVCASTDAVAKVEFIFCLMRTYVFFGRDVFYEEDM
jgi:hypothetical protein